MQEGVFKSFENYTIKLSATKKPKWTDKGARSCFSILKILILRYGFGLRETGPWSNITFSMFLAMIKYVSLQFTVFVVP